MRRALQIAVCLLIVIILGSLMGVPPHPTAAQGSQPATPTAGFPFPEGRLVYVGVTRDKDLEIFVSNTDGSGAKQLTFANNSPSSPVWSPDGKRIAFTATTSTTSTTRKALYVIDADGNNLNLLTAERTGPFRWSPDSTRIAFLSSKSGYNEVYVIDVTTRVEKQLTRNNTTYVGPAWSPDGKRLLYTRSDGLYIMNADGTNSRRVYGSPVIDVIWWPNGSEMLVVTDDDPDQIRPLRLDGEISDPVFAVDGFVLGMVWSPDGKRVAAVTREGGKLPEVGVAYLYTITVDNWNAQQIASKIGIEWASPSWSADSSFLTFSAEDSSLISNIYIADVYGTNARAVKSLGAAYFPAWNPSRGIASPCCQLGGPLPER